MNKPTVPLITTLFGQIKDYATNRLELAKLKTIDKTAATVSAIAIGLALFVVFFIFFLVLNIGIGFLIGHYVGGAHWGFLILAGFYLLVGLILFAARNKIFKTPITTMLIQKMLK